METTENVLTNRQLEVVRKNLVTVFRFSVKALIDKACFCSIDDGCEDFVNFSAALENVLQHRIRSGKTWYLGDDKSHFWMYIKAACHRHDLRSCINNIDNIENIKSPVAKGRAFIRCALMEKRLSDYLCEALKQTSVTRRYYQPGAILLGDDAPELCGVLLGLNSIDFGFCVKGENYDSVECPMAVSYTPFMKFKQSRESLYSDQQEMQELAWDSEVVEEEGEGTDNEPLTSDTWPDRYHALHKRYIAALQQKSFLEELTASQEKALQTAAVTQQESCRLQREAANQKQQYESVIIELQAQVARMKMINEAQQQQLVEARNARFHLTDLERKQENSAESSRFVTAMSHKQESDQQSLNGSFDTGATSSSSKSAANIDTRSVTSGMSEMSVEVATLSRNRRGTKGSEDTQSMLPLTGSLADLQLDLDSNNAEGSESYTTANSLSSSTIANPEQSTPVVSVSHAAYTIAFVESGEFVGNSEADNVYIRQNSARFRQQGEGEERGDPATPIADQQQQMSFSSTTTTTSSITASADETGKARATTGETSSASADQTKEAASTKAATLETSSANLPSENEDSAKRESSSKRESSPSSPKRELSPSSSASSPEVLEQEEGSDNGSSEDGKMSDPELLHATSGDSDEAATTPTTTHAGDSDRETASDPEILSQGQEEEEVDGASQKEAGSTQKEAEATQSEAGDATSGKETTKSCEGSEESPVSPVKEEDGSQDGEPSPPTHRDDDGGSATGDSVKSGDGKSPDDKSSGENAENPAKKTGDESSEKSEIKTASGDEKGEGGEKKKGAEGEKEGSGSDSGSSEGNKVSWDMLSDADHDSN